MLEATVGALLGALLTTVALQLPLNPEAARLFEQAQVRTTGALGQALLACHLESRVRFDLLSQNDLTVVFTAGEAEPRQLDGPDDAQAVFFTLPSVSLAPGQALTLEIRDREPHGGWHVVTTFETRYSALPLVLENERARLECRGVSPTDRDAELARWLAEADAAAVRTFEVDTGASASSAPPFERPSRPPPASSAGPTRAFSSASRRPSRRCPPISRRAGSRRSSPCPPRRVAPQRASRA